ncbi:anti-phage dCTP deaminase [Arthrobacter sp. FW306-04-A]|uniref:anti-phage dCTP deaminase n=1 Tax=Arthrobacter sp. FW306-04-A TaxID=2879619 RepID=UPI0037BE4286|nr:hypothetical protein LFT43_17955 [Arthrobacter sp. FW306-04-A]
MNGVVEQNFEVVIGLVAPIGTELDLLLVQLQSQLRRFEYDSEVIRLSALLGADASHSESSNSVTVDDGYYEEKMNLGDLLRKQLDSGDAVAGLAISKIRSKRLESTKSNSQERRFAWILRTLKHEDEVQLLRELYGSRFILIGVYQDSSSREHNLKQQLTYADPTLQNVAARVAHLMERDELDAASNLGQRVRETYSLADYFINMAGDLQVECQRLVDILFGSPFLTPTRDELSMFHAFAESLRSADPGRQVGAAITTANGELISLGCNDVPSPGGGLAWSGDSVDARDFRRGYDYNKRMTAQTMAELLDVLADSGALAEPYSSMSVQQRLQAIQDVNDGAVKRTRAMSLIEFGRISHAEMTAITQAARISASIEGATLYTTAFPCHMCMRLIIASGIMRVVYVDPYPKSLAWDMYTEALSASSSEYGNRVLVTPFWGTARKIFERAFSAGVRKRNPDGTFGYPDPSTQRWKLASADPLLGAEESESQLIIAFAKKWQDSKQALSEINKEVETGE